MSKKDYEKAARIVQALPAFAPSLRTVQEQVSNAFVALFKDDNPAFDEDRFRRACVPGANVKAKKAKVA